MNVLQRNNVVVSGSGERAMLFAHGFGCDQSMWRFVAPAFADEYRVVLFDHVGAGRSDVTAYDRAKYGSLDGYAEDVIEICDALELRDVVFVGHSVSSMIGIRASVRRPELFSHLVLLGPSPRYIDEPGYTGGFRREDIDQLLELQESNYLGWASYLAPAVIGDPSRPELVAELEGSFCRTQPDIARQFAAVTFLSDDREILGRVTVPTLILQSQVDTIASRVVGAYVHERIRGSQLVTLPVTGHCAHLSAPALTTAAMREFLAGVATPAA